MNLRAIALFAALVFSVGVTHANEAAPLADDPVVEKRLLAISEELRCLVCQNESLAGSRADLANDLRREIRTMIKDGKSDTEIMEFMTARYGDFVRYRPPVKPTTWLLWAGPFLLLVAGIAVLVRFLRGRRSEPDVPLSAADAKRAEAMLKEEG